MGETDGMTHAVKLTYRDRYGVRYGVMEEQSEDISGFSLVKTS